MPVGIFGVPMDLGQDRRGVDMGPSAIRYARLQDALEELGYDVTDLGNADAPIPETVEEGARSGIWQPCGTSAWRSRDAPLPWFRRGYSPSFWAATTRSP